MDADLSEDIFADFSSFVWGTVYVSDFDWFEESSSLELVFSDEVLIDELSSGNTVYECFRVNGSLSE
jgi:hypothetical protein